MGKVLVLAEKPSVGRDIARVLKSNVNKGAYIEGNKYVITWALGHGAWKLFQCYLKI